ncbi:MAG: M90 family metallopeptidase [Thermosynechococcaceae cyanobacterium]
MTEALIVLGLVTILAVAIFGYPVLVQARRNRLKRCPFPAQWAATVEQILPIYAGLSKLEQQRLQGHIQVFLAEKQFIGCGGLTVTPEMQVMIATVACLLLLNEQGQYFPKLRSILIYPDTYWVHETVTVGNGIVEERQVARLGESWNADQLVLSWAQVQYDLAHWTDGTNVILHEFAHQLDQADGRAEGVPILPPELDSKAWATVMTQGYQHLCQATERGRKTAMDPYGTTNPAEFFAVATETFFEKPQALQKEYPDLYAQLQQYYGLHPLEWRQNRKSV